MCTVTVVPHEQGVRLLCNRDERRARPPALPPQVHALGRRRAIFPVDPQGGGTWVGVNDSGLMVALLNVHRITGASGRAPRQSRGLVVSELLRCRALTDVAAAVENLDSSAFEPFRVVIVHGADVAVATSLGSSPIDCSIRPLPAPRLFTSSSLGDDLVGPPRQRLFERMVTRSASGWLGGQACFHDHQWSRRPEISVRMERNDALTVSRTTIDITERGPRLLYEAPLKSTSIRAHRWCSWY
jgi:hypothetical protein